MKLLRRLTRWPWFSREGAALAEELEDHRARVQADLEAGGMMPADAAKASRRVMGNTALIRDEARDVWIAPWIGGLWRDVRYGLRGLRREPTFSLTAIATIALGVATTSTVFSVVDAELWKPLPFVDPHRLIVLESRGPGQRSAADAISGADLIEWRASLPALSALATRGGTLTRTLQLDTATHVVATEVTADYFAAQGRPAVAGRVFTGEDARGSNAAVLTDRAWTRLFAADTSVIGRAFTLGDQPVVIVGVVRADDTIGTDSDLFVPIDESSASFLDRTRPTFYYAIGRLRPDVDVEVARSQVAALTARRAELDASRATHVIGTDSYRGFFTPNNWRPMYFFLGASLVVLLLSAVNVASLLLGRAFRRTREFALRGALGGGAGALVRQLLVEGAVLAVPGCVAGLLVTTWALALFSAELPAQSLARASGIPVDYRVWAFAFGVTAVTTALFVLMPLAVARRINLSGALGPGSRTSGRAGEGRARLVLLTAQMALTVILLSGAGLFLKSFAGLMRVPIGFEVDGRLAMRASLGGPAYESGAQMRQYADELLARARATPGLGDTAVASSSPLGSGPMVNFVASGAPEPEPGEAPRAIIRTVSPGYFRTLGIALERGREFSASDVDGGPRVAVVNEHLAREMFGDADPVGQVITLLPNARTPWTRQPGDLLVVGVAGNAKEIGIDEVAFKDIYVPFAQMPSPWVELVARANVPVATIAEPLRQAAAAIDPTIPVSAVSTFEQRLAGALQEDRFNMLLVSAFAGVALLLASIGIYGAVAYAVQARTRELGVRLALGARPSRLVGGVLWHAGRLGVMGGVVGVVATLAIARMMGDALYLVPGEHNGLLYGVSTTDPAMLAGALAGMVLVALVAGAIPARRVGRVDPVLALRNE